MGGALEVITGRLLNPGAALVAAGPNSGDSFAIRSTPTDMGPKLLGLWASCATAGLVRVRSPRMHDNTQGIKFSVPAGLQRNLLPDSAMTPMYSQDNLTVEIAGGGAETDALGLLIQYPELGGSAARFITPDQLRAQQVEMTTIEVNVTGSVVAGDWSPGTSINATNDVLKANDDYAILGWQSSVACCAVGLRGPDTGNYRVGGPSPIESIETRDWFWSLSQQQGTALIPVINQANRAGTQLFTCHTTAATAILVDLIVARMPGRTQL